MRLTPVRSRKGLRVLPEPVRRDKPSDGRIVQTPTHAARDAITPDVGSRVGLLPAARVGALPWNQHQVSTRPF